MEKISKILNVNVSSPFVTKDTKVSNVNVRANVNGNKKSLREVQQAAELLRLQLGASDKDFPFFCKVVRELSEATIANNLEAAKQPNTKYPIKLFTYLCNLELNNKR